jgi:HD-GYP domain-containing protein (c-di-GMP phosphodiesterase class II)
LLPVAVNTLCPAAALNFNLYVQPDPAHPALLYRERDFPLEAIDLERLAESGVRTLYIASAEQLDYQRYLREEVVQNERVPPQERYRILREATRVVFEEAFHRNRLDQIVQLTAEFGAQMAEILCSQDLVLLDLFSLMQHDYYTYTHATNVCTYSVGLANRLKIADRSEMITIATGALLHDVGKRHIQLSVLNKPGRLTDRERQLMQEHPRIGFEELCSRGDLSWGQLMMIYQHHERLNGEGYPVGLTAEEIHPWARICAVADVFDAITSQRPYHEADSIGAALCCLERQAGTAFDEDMVRCWIEVMGRR